MGDNKMGKNMKHALAFATKYLGWHTWDISCQATCNAIRSLAKRSLIETNNYNQFRLAN